MIDKPIQPFYTSSVMQWIIAIAVFLFIFFVGRELISSILSLAVDGVALSVLSEGLAVAAGLSAMYFILQGKQH